MPTTTDSTETPACASASRSAASIDSVTARWSAIRPFTQPCGFDRRRTQKAQAAVFQHADHQPRPAAARVESYCVNRFYCHGPLFLCRDAVVQPQIERLSLPASALRISG